MQQRPRFRQAVRRTSGEGSRSSSYAKDIALLILGLVIGVVSALIAERYKADLSFSQVQYERKLNAARDASLTVNQFVSEVLFATNDLDKVRSKMRASLSKGTLPSDDLVDRHTQLLQQLDQSVKKMYSAMAAHVISLYVLFEDQEVPSIDYERYFTRSASAELRERKDRELLAQILPSTSTRDQAKIYLELTNSEEEFFADLRTRLLEGSKKFNDEIISMVKELRPKK